MNPLLGEDSHEISSLIFYEKIFNTVVCCRLSSAAVVKCQKGKYMNLHYCKNPDEAAQNEPPQLDLHCLTSKF